jgi:hypothetical protein
MKYLMDFEAFEWWPVGQISDGVWIKSRWEELPKDNGAFRGRWILQDIS